MMPRLILHVGPAKCGSTSIQQFFALQKRPCLQKTHYVLLDPSEIAALNRKNPDESISAAFARLLSAQAVDCDVLILSHEYLFQCPFAMEHLCRLARNEMAGISIVGYSRRQSEFLISAYAQWLFRCPDTVRAAMGTMAHLGLDPLLFSGLERQLIACIEKDFDNLDIFGYRIFDWHHSYQNFRQSLSPHGAVIRCGVLPPPESPKTLLEDFCEKSGLTLDDGAREASRRVFNTGFDPDIVEAMNQGVAMGLGMPGPHEGNAVIDRISVKMGGKMGGAATPASPFLSKLKAYTDTYFMESNHGFCLEYGLDAAYFAPAGRYSKQEIRDIVKDEASRRAADPALLIQKNRRLSARLVKLCMEMASLAE